MLNTACRIKLITNVLPGSNTRVLSAATDPLALEKMRQARDAAPLLPHVRNVDTGKQ